MNFSIGKLLCAGCLVATTLLFHVVDQAEARFLRGLSSSAAANNGGMLLNLADPQYFSGYNPFLNWWKTGDIFGLVSTTNGTLTGQAVWDNGTYLTSDGELKSPLPADVTSFERGFFTPVNYPQYQYEGTSFNNFAGQQFDVTWTGCASPTVSVGGSLGAGGGVSQSANAATLTVGSSGYANVALRFTFTGISACYANPPRNIKIFQHQYASNVASGDIFNPDWLAAVKPFGFLRLMDWMQTNFNGISDSSQLADVNYSAYAHSFEMANGLGGISGTVLTVTGFNRGTPFAIGQRIVCPGCNNAATITSLGTGSGGVGTYNLSASSSVSSQVILGIPSIGANSAEGPKGGIAPSLACSLANAANTSIEYPIPMAATDQYVTDVATSFIGCLNAGLKVKYSYGNEDWNTGFNTYRYTVAQSTSDWAGYRAAQIMEILAGVYGTNSYNSITQPNSKWIGAIGTQLANVSVTNSNVSGAMAWINSSPSPLTLRQLFSQIDVAPYWGNFYDGVCITGITASATPTVTLDTVHCSSNFFTNGQVIKLFVNGGTMAGVLNNAFATVSSATTTSFIININTTGLTYGGSDNGAMDATIFKLADQSTALNLSTPATYPTKFAYFNQQMSKAILNGSATDPSYGTITVGSALNLGTATNSILDLFRQNALIAQQNGLNLSQYEGGPTQTLVGSGAFPLRPPQAVEFLNVSLFDAGVTGDSTNRSANLFATMYSQFNSVNGVYPAQFNDASPMGPFGPWGALRFFPGDTGNAKWQAIVAQNALGPYVDPTPAATGTYTYAGNTTNRFFTASACSSCTDSFTPTVGTAATKLILGITVSASSAVPTSAVCDGVALTLDASNAPGGGRTALVYSGAMIAGTATRTCNVTYSGNLSFQNREYYAATASGLISAIPLAVQSGNPQNTTPISYTKGALLFTTGACSGGSYSNTSGVSSGVTTTIASDIDNTAGRNAAMAMFNAPFTSSIFFLSQGCAAEIAAAVYR